LRKPWIVPIPGTTNKDHMLQNTAATGVSLTSAEMTELTRSLDAITIQGQRLPDAVQVYSDVEAPLKS
jgi:diketogulonate reductase-like aldo/keto reductase